MMKVRSLLCENCEEESLQWCANVNDGEGGYLCPSWKRYSNGSGCSQVVSTDEFNERYNEKEEKNAKERREEEDDDEKENDEPYSTHHDRKAENVAALLSGNLVVSRQSLLPKVLSVSDSADVIRRPFKSPCPGINGEKTAELLRRLNARKRFVPWCSSREALSPLTNFISIPPPLSSAADDYTAEELP
eukprot:c43839_g1_i1 orf=2-565(-)